MKWMVVVALALTACISTSKETRYDGATTRAAAAPLQNVEVVSLKFASAPELARTVNELVVCSTSIRVLADVRTNSLVIQAPPEDLSRILELVARLDVEVR